MKNKLYQAVEGEIKKLQAFKDYVHKRLDDAGIPTHPDGEHSKAGCRIGDRLDLVLTTQQTRTLTELTDEEINARFPFKDSENYTYNTGMKIAHEGAKWYREELRKRFENHFPDVRKTINDDQERNTERSELLDFVKRIYNTMPENSVISNSAKKLLSKYKHQ